MSNTAGLPVQTATEPSLWRGRLAEWLAREAAQLPLWAPVMLGIGIAGYFILPWSQQRCAMAGVAATVVPVALVLRLPGTRLLVWAAALVLLGLGLAAWRTEHLATPRLIESALIDISGTVVAIEDRTGRGEQRIIIATEGATLPPNVRVTWRGLPLHGVAPGARIALRARLGPPASPAYPGGADFARAAWFDGLGATGAVMGPIKLLTPAPAPDGLAAWLGTVRLRLNAHLHAALPGPPGTIAAALVTGDQGAIPPDVVQDMRNAGLAHLLSISGLHIAVVVAGSMWLVRRTLLLSPWIGLRWRVKLIAAAAAALVGIGYTVLAGSEVPAVRACIATLIVLTGLMLGREALTLRLVATAAFVILVVRPEALLGPSFQLSFAAVTGLVALYQSRLGQWLGRPSPVEGWAVRLGRNALALLVSGLVAEAMLSATALFHFNQTGLYGVIANLLAIPLTSFVIIPLLIVALVLSTVGAAAPVFWLLGKAIGGLLGLAAGVADWPGAVLRLPAMGGLAYALLIAGGLWLCLWQSRLRWAGIAPLLAGAVMAVSTPPPDLLISADGRHVAILTQDGQLALLRSRGGTWLRSAWSSATAADMVIAFEALPGAQCSRDACVAAINSGKRSYRLLATRSSKPLDRSRFEAACRSADLVVSNQHLPGWCAPHWLRLDRAVLGQTEAVTVRFESRQVETVAARTGDHPWQRQRSVWGQDGR